MKKLTKQIIGGTILMSAILLAPSALFALPPGMEANNCTVNSKLWTLYPPPDSFTLPRAMAHANMDSSSGYKACAQSITIKVDDQIEMLDPLPIRISGTGEGSRFELIGDTAANEGFVVLNARRIDVNSLPDGKKCAVIVYGGYVSMQKIKIVGLRDGMTGVCIKGNYAEMDGVQILGGTVDDAGVNGSGFEGDTTTKETRILPTSSVQGVSGKGVWFRNPAGGNILKPTDGTIGATQANGFATIEGETTRFMIEAVGTNPGDYIVAENPVAIQIHQVARVEEAEPYILVRGAVVDLSDGKAITDCTATISNIAQHIQVYKTGGTALDGSEMHGGFYGYVGTLTDEGFGLGNVGDMNGFFQISMPVAGTGSAGQIIMLPEISGGYIGKPSKVINIADDPRQIDCYRDWGDRTGESALSDSDGDGVPDTGTSTIAKFVGYKSVAACQKSRHWTPSMHMLADANYDSDGDGWKDNEEDLDRDCDCDIMESCWYKADTDGDAIPDKKEGNCISLADVSAPNYTLPTACVNAAYDVDGDNYGNAVDPDRDNDGRQDYQEDRNFYYVQNAGGTLPTMGVLYHFESVFGANPIPYRDDAGVRHDYASCPLRNMDRVGAWYAWYIVRYESDGVTVHGEPQLLGDSGAFPVATEPATDIANNMEILLCRNQILASPANFNGRREVGNIETKLDVVDSDGDGWCDGNNEPNEGDGKCSTATDYKGNNDDCPTVYDEDNLCKTLACSEGSNQVLFSVNPKYVVFEGGSPRIFRDTGPTADTPEDGSIAGDSIPDVLQVKTSGVIDYQKIKILCFGDIDDDGIPDCVEHPSITGRCTDPDSETGLFFNKRDSDDDNLIDGWNRKGGELSDVCPASSGGPLADKFEEGKTHYSCPPTQVYTRERIRILSCFLDRDGDEIRDCMEDKNMDGLYNNKVPGVAGILTTESNPLARDSDVDGVSDQKEINGWDVIKTNPSDTDTDHDDISDFDEDHNHNGVIEIDPADPLLQGSDLCPDALTRDTDPTKKDTDGDTMEDNVELTAGDPVMGQAFIDRLTTLDAFAGGGIDVYSDPRSKDSDNDGLDDNEEYTGSISYNDSHPCMKDSDGDGVNDGYGPSNPHVRQDGCPLNAIYSDPALCGEGGYGPDSDRDGEPDAQERLLGTDPRNPDTDGDGLLDGQEDFNHNGIYEPTLRETDATVADTDSDGLNDGFEDRYVGGGGDLDPTNSDTDGDCIVDGVEDANQNGDYNAGSETDATVPDTDGDGLPDGQIGGIGEDLDCNGQRNREGDRWTETDPRLPDSDFDGRSDYDEMTQNGGWNYSANIEDATSRHEGCMIAGGAGSAPTSMIYLFGLILIVNRAVSRCLRKR